MNHKLITLLMLLLFSEVNAQSDTLSYLFLGHIKKNINGQKRVDPRVEGIDMNYYDRIWLGGDVTSESNSDWSVLHYIDSLFDVSNPSNHWTYGNHDLRNYNDEWLREVTEKNTYYAHHENGITTIVLNLAITPMDCEKLNDQFEMIQTVCDTISASSHLILMSHHCPWFGIPGLPSPGHYAHSNFKEWISNCDDSPGTFVASIYPMLIDVKEKGINVINILGDSGASNKGISMLSDDGIYFIASGIDYTTEDEHGPDQVLIFKHHPQSEFLDWNFHNLDSLYQSFQ